MGVPQETKMNPKQGSILGRSLRPEMVLQALEWSPGSEMVPMKGVPGMLPKIWNGPQEMIV